MRLITERRPSSAARRQARRFAPADPSNVAVFTAVDGTLLDPRTFEPGPNRRAIRRLHAAGIPVIPMTVMTLEEIEPLAQELGLRHAMVVEAGGAMARWREGRWELEACGPDAEALLEAIREIEDRSGANLLVYAALPEPEAARVSGRTGEMLRRSTRRRFSEPFTIESGSVASVAQAAAALGFSVRRGRRFYHLTRASDEGDAFLKLRHELGCDVAIALGGSPLDADFLRRAEAPIVVPGPDGKPDRELLSRVPRAWIAPSPAPQGWSEAVNVACAGFFEPKKRRISGPAPPSGG
jgi:mannosyl-3-phosphoglycerate phosphatase